MPIIIMMIIIINNNGVSEVEPVEFIVCLLHDFAQISVPGAAASQS